MPGSAGAFNPFGELHTTGASQEALRQRARPPATTSARLDPADAWDAPSAPITRAPAVLEGGPRPSIAGTAPARVAFRGGYAAGSVVIDTGGRRLYYVLSPGQAYSYPIAVGREGFTWTGTEKVSRKAAWPDWRPPKEMLVRDPRLPKLMTGGVRNPLGAMAIYLGDTLYRIHGTNDARSIGQAGSSGCFRMTNAHVMHLAGLVQVGTSVHVLSRLPARRVAGREAGPPS